jgi:hypothetical protein
MQSLKKKTSDGNAHRAVTMAEAKYVQTNTDFGKGIHILKMSKILVLAAWWHCGVTGREIE